MHNWLPAEARQRAPIGKFRGLLRCAAPIPSSVGVACRMCANVARTGRRAYGANPLSAQVKRQAREPYKGPQAAMLALHSLQRGVAHVAKGRPTRGRVRHFLRGAA